MPQESTTLFILVLILAIGLVVPAVTSRLRLPFVTTLIILGAALGPKGFDYVGTNDVIDFFAFIGFTLLMFLAGLETKTGELRKSWKKILTLAFFNGGIPLIVGMIIARGFGLNWTVAFLVGTIFVSSSIALAIPAVKSIKLFDRHDGQQMIAAILLLDSVSLVFLAIIFQSVDPLAFFPLPIHFFVLALSLLVLRIYLPKIAQFFLRRTLSEKAEHEDQLRFIIVILFFVLAFFELLGVHPILAAFVTGLLLSDLVTSRHIFEKLHVLAYGIFIPVFFFVVGMQMDLSLLVSFDVRNMLLLTIVLGLILAKFLSGLVGGLLTGIGAKNGAIFGTLTTVQLTTTLAATYSAANLGLLDNALVTAILTLSVITTIFAPLMVEFISDKMVERRH